jgi:hypothetical protein
MSSSRDFAQSTGDAHVSRGVRHAEGLVQHASDCALHNAPALPVRPCDCGASAGRHTPKPWVFEPADVEEDGSVYPARIVGGRRELIVVYLNDVSQDAMCEGPCDYRSKSANIHLMLAAPDLYEALRAAYAFISAPQLFSTPAGGPKTATYRAEGYNALTAKLRAAIAKAEGLSDAAAKPRTHTAPRDEP